MQDIEDLVDGFQDRDFINAVSFEPNTEINVYNPKPLKWEPRQELMRRFIIDLLENFNDSSEIQKEISRLSRIHHIMPSKTNIIYTYRDMIRDGAISPSPDLESHLGARRVRANSGVIVITVVASPTPNGQKFSCEYDCHYCPKEPAHAGNNYQEQPRSYIFNEPGVRRANRNGFDAVLQVRDRIKAYIINGLPVDKLEIIILGGTWHSYPAEYREEFIRDLFYAANTLYLSTEDSIDKVRPKKSVVEERQINESTKHRIIGVTIETRPDQITKNPTSVLTELRRLGVTRVQLGVQHTDNKILKLINRRCSLRHAIKAFRILKDNGIKIIAHWMPDLPGSSFQKDLDMFNYIIDSEDLQADEWKIYPCMTVPWTQIKKWYDEGSYKPYSETNFQDGGKLKNPLIELLIKVMSHVPPWIRLCRVIRDIPDDYLLNIEEIKTAMSVGGFSNLRQVIHHMMKTRGLTCMCIRCREIKDGIVDTEAAKLVTRQYKSSCGDEYFLSFESGDALYGFLRLRIPGLGAKTVFPELHGAALIRELHVYGHVVEHGKKSRGSAQHMGFGTKLLDRAEEISRYHGLRRMSVIAGDGAKPYYRKKKFVDGEYYMHRLVALE